MPFTYSDPANKFPGLRASLRGASARRVGLTMSKPAWEQIHIPYFLTSIKRIVWLSMQMRSSEHRHETSFFLIVDIGSVRATEILEKIAAFIANDSGVQT